MRGLLEGIEVEPNGLEVENSKRQDVYLEVLMSLIDNHDSLPHGIGTRAESGSLRYETNGPLYINAKGTRDNNAGIDITFEQKGDNTFMHMAPKGDTTPEDVAAIERSLIQDLRGKYTLLYSLRIK